MWYPISYWILAMYFFPLSWFFFFFFFPVFYFNIFIGVKLLYNGVLVSALYQSASAIHIHISPYLPLASPSHPPYPTPLGSHKAPSWSPCAMQLLPCLAFSWSEVNFINQRINFQWQFLFCTFGSYLINFCSSLLPSCYFLWV